MVGVEDLNLAAFDFGLKTENLFMGKQENFLLRLKIYELRAGENSGARYTLTCLARPQNKKYKEQFEVPIHTRMKCEHFLYN